MAKRATVFQTHHLEMYGLTICHRERIRLQFSSVMVTVYPVTANGDVSPSRTIRSGPAERLSLNIGNPGAVGYDTLRDQILVPN